MGGENNNKKGLVERWLPHPTLTLLLVILWLLLMNGFSAGLLIIGIILAVAIQLITSSYWPHRPLVKNYWKVFSFILVVVWDVIVANIQVARLILFRPIRSFHSRWVSVPLDLKAPEAITIFAGVITMTPGTVSSDFSADGRSLLVHCLDAPDADAAVRFMKTRYEARLLEIFS